MNLRRAPAAVPLVLALAACGGPAATDDDVVSASRTGATASASASPSPTLDPQQAALKFAQCMRQHGIDMPDPQGGDIRLTVPRGASKEKMDKAQKACGPIMESAVKAGTPSAEDYDKMLKFAQCMRAHGVDVADPKPGQPMRIMAKGGSKDKLEAAHKACEEYAPGMKKGPAGGGGGS
ncbi:hypothetical protein MF672_021305 [Actinomadura sp. ATCC 31491]|uniref:Secreted protein n=1 Tax=Actinomadura luzonensis TaxID=2805427 RepID=A0ABT0FVG5_9ACTN|nr:hypothetical protein [Actinomadura luzonensis]MCK2216319.1 hypothetical protein [Actinomadura luzonensis]